VRGHGGHTFGYVRGVAVRDDEKTQLFIVLTR
jgi:hypothetical protein